MNYLVCDMNCNNMGNYFAVVCLQNDIKVEEGSYVVGNTYYPKGSCYLAKLGICKWQHEERAFYYSEAIDYLFPKEYARWYNKLIKIK